jgi:hypothetical protein
MPPLLPLFHRITVLLFVIPSAAAACFVFTLMHSETMPVLPAIMCRHIYCAGSTHGTPQVTPMALMFFSNSFQVHHEQVQPIPPSPPYPPLPR